MRAFPLPREQKGFTLIEVIVSLVIVSTSMIWLLAVLGDATDDVIETIRRRKMRYLMQIVLADVEVGKISLEEEEERYEEGSTESLADWSSEENPDEYENFEYEVKVLRDVPILGGAPEDEESLIDGGWELDAEGRAVGRPVSNDLFGTEGEGEGALPAGQYKRLLVLTIRALGEDADDDAEFEVMTYLPVPNEESQTLGTPAEEGAGEGGGTAPGATPGATPAIGGSGASSDNATRGGGGR